LLKQSLDCSLMVYLYWLISFVFQQKKRTFWEELSIWHELAFYLFLVFCKKSWDFYLGKISMKTKTTKPGFAGNPLPH
jgi:hypothetical protein